MKILTCSGRVVDVKRKSDTWPFTRGDIVTKLQGTGDWCGKKVKVLGFKNGDIYGKCLATDRVQRSVVSSPQDYKIIKRTSKGLRLV